MAQPPSILVCHASLLHTTQLQRLKMNVFFTLLVLAAASAQEPLLPAFVLAGRADLLPARAEATAAALREAVLARRPAVAVFLTAPGASAAAVARATAAGGAPTLAALVAARPSVELALDQGQGGVGVSRSPVGLLDAAAALARGAAPVVVDAAAPSLGELDAALPGLVAAAERAAGTSFVVVVAGAARCGRQKVSSSRPSAGESKRGESRTLAHWLISHRQSRRPRGARAAPRAAAPPRGRAGHAGRRPPDARRRRRPPRRHRLRRRVAARPHVHRRRADAVPVRDRPPSVDEGVLTRSFPRTARGISTKHVENT